jgi:hypothetical protein
LNRNSKKLGVAYQSDFLLLLLRSKLEEGRSARSSYPVSDWTGMKLILKMAWIGFLLAQRVAHLPGTDGLGRNQKTQQLSTDKRLSGRSFDAF